MPWNELPGTEPAHEQVCWIRLHWYLSPFQATWIHAGDECGWVAIAGAAFTVPWFIAPKWRAL